MSSAISHALILNRVRLSLGESVTPTQKQQWQRQVNNALSQVSLHPDLPPQAILVVRRLPDSQPGSLLSDNCWRGLRGWEQAAQNALNDCWRTAVRPAQVPVSTTANSVWFTDQAEWLACLSWDVYRGVAGARWWWQAALRPHTHRSRTEILFQLWREEVQWLPAALTLLLHQNNPGINSSDITTLLAELTSSQSRQLLEQVIEVYQCPLPLSLSSLITALRPHLAPAIRNLIQPLLPEMQALVAVCLSLPSTSQFLQESLSLAIKTGLPVAPDAELSELEELAQQQPTEQPLPTVSPESTPPEVAADNDRVIPHHSIPKIVAIQSTPLESLPDPVTDLAQGKDKLPNPALEQSQSPSPLPGSAPVPLTDSPNLSLPLLSATNPTLVGAEQGIFSGVGGLWYLVNVLGALNWPGRSPILTPWHQLSALAQALLPEVPPDPVWGLLAEIAGDTVPTAVLSQWQEDTLDQVRLHLVERLEQPEAISNYILEPATLYLTRTHVDVVFTLDQIRLDVRMAGLDRDPGWVPELARAIAFHYE